MLTLKEAEYLLCDLLYEEAKQVRYDENDGHVSPEGRVAARRIEAWDYILLLARATNGPPLVPADIQDLNQQVYALKVAVGELEGVVGRYRKALHEAGVEIAKLQVELMSRG